MELRSSWKDLVEAATGTNDDQRTRRTPPRRGRKAQQALKIEQGR